MVWEELAVEAIAVTFFLTLDDISVYFHSLSKPKIDREGLYLFSLSCCFSKFYVLSIFFYAVCY